MNSGRKDYERLVNNSVLGPQIEKARCGQVRERAIPLCRASSTPAPALGHQLASEVYNRRFPAEWSELNGYGDAPVN